MKRVIGIGNALTDMLVNLESDSVLGRFKLAKGSMSLVDTKLQTEISKSVAGLPYSLSLGGSAGNTIRAMAKLGCQVGFIGKVGQDTTGDFFVQALENLGVEISGGDDKFLQQLNEAIDHDIADPALNLDALCRRIGLSRASLYRKLMSATGLSPARYIQSVRLNLAARMLRETQMSVSEIATASGFNSLIHFSASFRKQYGVPPSRYAAGQEATGPEAAPGRENEPQE